MKTVVGLFSTTAAAEKVRQTLLSEGYEVKNVSVVANDEGPVATSGSSTTAAGVGHKIGEFFSNLVGGDEHAHHHYATGVNAGGALLTVTTTDEEANEVAALLKQHGARDIEGGHDSKAYEGERMNETAIPIVEEELVVGKREVDRGGVRVYSHVVEHPASADVTLHNESVSVERRPVNRPATAADFATGSGSFEVRATGEEAVIGKSSRVVEEVLVGKEATEHTQQVHDKVRKTEVEVEHLTGSGEKSKY